MKKIYQIGTKQEFTYTSAFLFFKGKTEEYWVIRNVKYIYAEDELEAKSLYKNWFFYEYKTIVRGWGNWHLCSDGVSVQMNEGCIDITSTEIVSLIDENIVVNLEELKKDMHAENFKEWWFSR